MCAGITGVDSGCLGFNVKLHLTRWGWCRFLRCINRRDAPTDKPGSTGAALEGSGDAEDVRTRQGILKYKCYSTSQVDGRGNPLLLREAGLFSKIPEQILLCSDINQNFTMLAVSQ